MKTELFTVSRVFTESLFRIPDYQRGYSWGKDQLRDFWLDLEQLRGDSKHYTGVLTLEAVPEEQWKKWDDDIWIIQAKRFKPYYVVDGQQRLTTVIILLCVVLELGRPAHLNFTSLQDVRRKYICDSKPEDQARSYVFGYEKDNPSYEFLKKRILSEGSNVHLSDEVTIYTKNLLAAKEFFVGKIKDMSDGEVEGVFSKLTQQLVFNVYEITADIDVFVTFETMNNRGKPLSTLELLKNRLIYLASRLPTPEHRNNVLRTTVNEAWKSAYHYLGKNDERVLDDDQFLKTFLATFYISKLAQFPAQKNEEEARRAGAVFQRRMEGYSRFLLSELFSSKRIGESGGFPELSRDFIFDFAQQLKNSVELYFKLSTPAESNFSDREKVWLERLGRLRGYSPSAMVFALYQKESRSDKRSKFLELIERYYFLEALGGYDPRVHGRWQYNEIFVSYVGGHLNTDEVISSYENLIEGFLRDRPLAEVVPDWIKNGVGYYGWRPLKYFMFEYELHLSERAKTEREKILWKDFCREEYGSDYETIEHIYPQRARDKYWTDRFSKYSTAEKRYLRNSIGNLLALSRPKNSAISNLPFPARLGDAEKKTGYRYGSYSEIEVSQLKEWNADAIATRGIRLLEFMQIRWRLQLGDLQQKLRLLNLEFLAVKFKFGADGRFSLKDKSVF